ncbi:leucine--tRNA ligase [Aurantibacter aestuarii]|uniref:Leucine--tRNA ligase n=1 Tax=Aurantibacter aestuarii TaxID=1266046 RepID=A0A2T1NCF2_9FLAO|nr:class I tRNA ligase family protein [Aurantibacter aestuarii]PSG90123.1 leucine--tRNA ligase [Aurantibacter aestuarii]
MHYNFNDIEAKWQKYWNDHQTFKASNNSDKPKYYVLDMFPYPSGAGLHVGHPLGYIASDIYARYKRHQGFNVLHPQGYDSFGLPAEQYAIQTGQHPKNTTEINIDGCLDNEGNLIKKYLKDDGTIKDSALIEKGKIISVKDENYQNYVIKGYRRQLDKIGFSFDWSREVRTSDPDYYKWTQWIFIQLFESWYNNETNKAEPIDSLTAIFSSEGNANVNAVCDEDIEAFTADQWNAFSSEKQQDILLQYRLTYLAETEVNWCPVLGTVLANDEIVNGVSERGGHPVIRKKMTQWSMRISAYAERLLQGLETVDFTESLKETQRNWIGKSQGAEVEFRIQNSEFRISVFTTRPDTIFGVSFMTLAPEHDLVNKITTPEQQQAVNDYIEATAKRSERDRMADVKTISGVFTGAYAEHPFTKEPIPVWIGDYVLASYGTGAVMAVPCGDQRDYDFAKHFNIPIPNIFEGVDISTEAFTGKDNVVIANSGFLNGLNYKKATKLAIYNLEQLGQGKGKTNYRLRDAVFSRQRYWGEPFPVYYVNGKPQMIATEHLPIVLPEVEKYLPTEEGEPPLGRADVWAWCTKTNKVVSNQLIDHKTVFPLELNTMPGWAGSSWYFFRYMEEKANRDQAFASEDALNYWESVDLYIGGSEHATGHLLYSRFWVKFLKDRGFVNIEEPFKKLINQGMILGTSAFASILKFDPINISENQMEDISKLIKRIGSIFISYDYKKIIPNSTKQLSLEELKNIDENLFNNIDELIDLDSLPTLRTNEIFIYIEPFYPININFVDTSNKIIFNQNFLIDHMYLNFKKKAILNSENEFIVSREVEKMSKSKYNVVSPDAICAEYGADSLRLYEMFLGPLEQYKPWNTAGITGVHGFLKKLWKLYIDDNGVKVTDAEPTKDNLKTLHKTIKKVQEDIENFSFNTSVSTFMIAVNELGAQKCTSREILEPLLVLISPYAPHIAEELYSLLGHTTSISTVTFPKFDESHLIESSKVYPVSFNGKMRFTMELPLDLSKDEIEKIVMADERTQKQLDGKTPKKVIIVPGKIINLAGF